MALSLSASYAAGPAARDASVDQFLAKPFSPRRLVQALHHAILYPRPNVVYVEVVID
jgi:CheY-like chemotaxis protein